MIPVEAVEAAAKASYEARGGIDWDLQSDELRDAETVFTRAALEAAALYMLSHEADELAAEYRRGYRDGLADRKQVTVDPREWEPGDPIE